MQVAQYFNDIYRKHGRYWWQSEDRYSLSHEQHPLSLLTQLTLKLLADEPQLPGGQPRGRALDLGAGEGPDSIRLALLGYQVDAVEISEVAADKIKAFAADAGVGGSVNVMVGDIAHHIPAGPYDVVICNGVLHYVPDKAAVVTRMKQVTCAGGVNVVSLWSNYTPVPDCHNGVPVYADDEQGTVTDLYADWLKEFIYFERDKPESSHSDLPPHRHSHIKLITRRPGTGKGTASA
jgi:tellurite methyltransferase